MANAENQENHESQSGNSPEENTQQDNREQQQPESADKNIERLEQEIAALRKENAKARVTNRELKNDAEAWRKQQEEEKTELQRSQELSEKLQSQLKDAENEKNRLTLAVKHGIPHDDLELLGGGDFEAMEARAQRLAELHKKANQNQFPSDRPKENMRAGDGKAAKEEVDDAYPQGWI